MQNSSVSASTNMEMHSTTETVIRVLYVDDEKSLLETTKSILELQTSFQVETVSSVDEALRKMSENEFDVILSDYQMPIKSGLDFLKELRDSGNGIPFILFTGKGREEVAVKALNLGADRYFNKIGHPETVYGELAHGIIQLARKKGVENQLRRLSSVIEQSSNTVVILDKEETIVYANPTFLAFHEVHFEDVVGKNWQQLIPEGNPLRTEHQNILDTVLKQKKTWIKEICGIYDNGKIAWRRARIFPIFDEKTKVTHFVYSAEDIAEQKKNEQTIWDREERLRAIIASSPDAMIVTDLHGNVTDCNIETLNLLGVSSRKEIMGEDCYNFITKEDVESVRLSIPNLLQQGAINNVECKLLTKTGSKIDVEFSANTLRDAYGKPVGAVVLARDITERKKVEDAIRKSEEKYRNIVELSPDGITVMTMKGTITSVNKAFLDLTGFSREEIEGKHFTKLGTLRAKDIPKWIKLVGEFLKGKKHTRTEFVYKHKDGTERLGDAYISLLEEKGQKLGLQAILRDITEERKMQQALQDSEEKYRNIVELSPDGIISLDTNGIVTAVNRAILQQTGFAETDFVGKHFTQLEAVPSETLSGLTKKIASFFKGQAPETFELCYNCKDGKQLCAEATVGLLKQNNKNVGIQLVFRDITERKKAEEKLRDSEEKFRTISHSAQDSIILLDENGKIIYWNPTAEKTFGYTKREAIGKELHSFVAPERFYEDYQRGFIKFQETGQGSAIGKTLELFAKRKDGTEFPIELSLSSLKNKGKWCATGIIRDITERKNAEQENLESEKRFRELTELLPEVIFEYDLNGKLTYVNNEAYTRFGYSTEEFENGLNVLQFMSPECVDKAKLNISKILNGKRSAKLEEYKLIRKDGSTFPAIITAAPISKENKIVGIRGILIDITERKKAEEKHLESEKKFREMAELLPEVIFEYDLNGKLTYANPLANTKFGFSEEEFEKGINVFELVAPESRENARNNFAKLLNGEKPGYIEFKLIRKDGTTFPAIITSTSIIRDNKMVGVRGVLVDITESKKADNDLRQSQFDLNRAQAVAKTGSWRLDIQHNVLLWSDETYKIFGVPKGTPMTYEAFLELVHPEDRVYVDQKWQGALLGEPYNIDHRIIVNGNVKWIQEKAELDLGENGVLLGGFGTAQDITDLKKMEQDLKDSEEKYHTQFEENLDAIFLADTDTGILLGCNRAATRLVGRRKSEIVGKHQNILHPPQENPNAFTPGFIEHSKTKDEISLESQIITKKGEVRDVIIKGNVIKLGKRNVVQGIFRDITEYKKGQDNLLKERDTLEKVTGNLSASLVVISKDLRVQWTNKYLKNIVGDASGQLCYSALNRLGHFCPGCKINEVIKTGKKATYEVVIPRSKNPNYSEGQELLLEITAIPITDKNGEVTEVLELAIDITERKKMENAIREAEEQYRVLMDSANVLITSVDEKGKYIYINEEWRRVFGYSDEEIKKITILDTVRSDHKQQCLKDIELVTKGKPVNDIDTVFVTKNGKEIHARGNARPIISNGKLISTVAVFLDITQHQKAENKVKETLKKVETINEKLGVIGKLTRHDTRNKLATIVNSTYLAKTQIDNKESALKHLDNVDATIDQIEKILEFSRIYELLGTQEKTNIDVKTILDEAFMLASQSDEIELLNECNGLTVQADSLLRQVFYNLIENSIKHGEKITQIKVNYKPEKTSVKIIYTDNGIGIPENEKEKIFQEGYGKGTGYGLYLIQKICDEYGWTITENGELDKGAKFVITIPK